MAHEYPMSKYLPVKGTVNVNVNVNVNLNNLNNLNTSLTKELIDAPLISPLNSRKHKEAPKIKFDKPVSLTEADETQRAPEVIPKPGSPIMHKPYKPNPLAFFKKPSEINTDHKIDQRSESVITTPK